MNVAGFRFSFLFRSSLVLTYFCISCSFAYFRARLFDLVSSSLIQELVHKLKDAQYFINRDICWGYNNA
jgi:hypothetical protein